MAIAALEDKIVQGATVLVLNAIYEENFLGFSYGFRPQRGAHDAPNALAVAITKRKVNYILGAELAPLALVHLRSSQQKRLEAIMRIYLSSFKLRSQPKEFQRLVGPVRRAAIIMNALDNFADQRALWLDGQTRALTKLGFGVIELDLRFHFQRSNHLQTIVDDIDAVWVNGGNAFTLRRATKKR